MSPIPTLLYLYAPLLATHNTVWTIVIYNSIPQLTLGVFHCDLTGNTLNSKTIVSGAIIALPVTLLGYFFVPSYHDYLVSGWSNPYTWVLGGLIGLVLAVVTD